MPLVWHEDCQSTLVSPAKGNIMSDNKNHAAPNTVQRTERGKDERLEEDEAIQGEPVGTPRPGMSPNMTRDKGVEPAANDRRGSGEQEPK